MRRGGGWGFVVVRRVADAMAHCVFMCVDCEVVYVRVV
jgi:hypothetical protein